MSNVCDNLDATVDILYLRYHNRRERDIRFRKFASEFGCNQSIHIHYKILFQLLSPFIGFEMTIKMEFYAKFLRLDNTII